MARNQNDGILQTATATADLTGKSGYGIALDTSNVDQVVIGNAQTTKNIGVLIVEGVAGQRVTFKPFHALGTATVIYGGTVAVGDWLTLDSAGKFIATTTDKDQVVGRAKEAGSAGEYHEVYLESFTLSA